MGKAGFIEFDLEAAPEQISANLFQSSNLRLLWTENMNITKNRVFN